MTATSFQGASAIVSGGAGGLGAATVRRLHAEGLGVVIADLAEDQGTALATELGERATFVRTDVTDEASVVADLDAAAELGDVRFAVVAHGGFGVNQRVVGKDGSPADYSGFTKTVDLYLNGTFNVLRLAAARIAKTDPLPGGERGAVVMTASIAGYEGQIGQASYTAAKAGVIGLTLVAARDLGATGIRVNTIAPGTMRTPIMESVGEDLINHLTSSIPYPRRLGEPAEFADAVAFLLANQYVNGHVLRLDGAQRFAPR
ncbi:3-hydroxyacyl-CoA dehydrogenase type-2 [Mycolicibacterium hassiacum DSM 44199]|uniref:3-hydroxyacyl-CoA dehydrogenase type-2 n=1 Tax=Mycolicibacterium hassiacum (strain DSM 44199 / CIP 105218 / JCM 12690 / 3849) TaxID=1122247 RepID=K5BA53_MYCHD|nr:SDR family oxidoreductase [Mycolicibacterium hassiacum]EKF21640.1 3-hydroxyacyl-CoA dehydrogenase type-2 [Mycolicibacterium hassiacum DSM 44199]VCT91279.1 putative oxidoreductase [Mycolicibacterium hassiacum DSM 44199]